MSLPHAAWLVFLSCLALGMPLGRADLVGRWSFDDFSLRETSGFQPAGLHDGEALGAVRFSEDVPPGWTGASVEFVPGPGSNGVRIANTKASDAGYRETFDEQLKKAGQMTVAFWIKAPRPPDGGTPAEVKQREYTGIFCKWASWTAGTNQVRSGFSIVRSGVSPALLVNVAQASGEVLGLGGNVPVFDDRWHHVAVTRDGEQVRLYVDGRLNVAMAERMVDWRPHPGQPLMLGTLYDVFRPLRGRLDEVRVYNTALSPDEVAALMRPTP